MAKKNRVLWKYFTVLEPTGNEGSGRDGRKHKFARCHTCKQVFKMNEGSTSPLRNHMNSFHPDLYHKLCEEEREEKVADEEHLRQCIEAERQGQPNGDPYERRRFANLRNKPTVDKQTNITNYASVIKYKKKSTQQMRVDLEMCKFIITSALAYNVADHHAFQAYNQFMHPEAHTKCARTFARNKTNVLYREMKKELNAILKKDMEKVHTVAFTSDGWQAYNGKSFLSLTCHYITDDFEPKSYLLECQSFSLRHTGENIATVIDQILEQYPSLTSPTLDRVITTDGATNMINACKQSKYMQVRITCIDHVLNNAIRETVSKNAPVSRCFEKCKEIIARLNQSNLDQSIVDEAAEFLELPSKKLIRPTATRWNSWAMAVTSVVQMQEVLTYVKQNRFRYCASLANSIPSEREFALLKSVQPLLLLIKEYSDKFEGESCLVQRFLVDIYNIICQIEKLVHLAKGGEGYFDDLEEGDREVVIGLMETFRENLKTRQVKYGNDYLFAKAAVLNPFYKGIPLFRQGLYDRVVDNMVDEHPTTREWEDQHNEDIMGDFQLLSDTEIGNMTGADRDLYERRLERAARRDGGQLGTEPPLKKEIALYQEKYNCDKEDNHLGWWKKHATALPLMAQLVKDNFAIQVSSAASERVFSLGGRIVTSLRSGLSPELTTKQVFIAKNASVLPCNMNTWNYHNREDSSEDSDPETEANPKTGKPMRKRPARNMGDFTQQDTTDVADATPQPSTSRGHASASLQPVDSQSQSTHASTSRLQRGPSLNDSPNIRTRIPETEESQSQASMPSSSLGIGNSLASAAKRTRCSPGNPYRSYKAQRQTSKKNPKAQRAITDFYDLPDTDFGDEDDPTPLSQEMETQDFERNSQGEIMVQPPTFDNETNMDMEQASDCDFSQGNVESVHDSDTNESITSQSLLADQ